MEVRVNIIMSSETHAKIAYVSTHYNVSMMRMAGDLIRTAVDVLFDKALAEAKAEHAVLYTPEGLELSSEPQEARVPAETLRSQWKEAVRQAEERVDSGQPPELTERQLADLDRQDEQA